MDWLKKKEIKGGENMEPIKVVSFGHRVPQEIRGQIQKQYPGAHFLEVPFTLDMGQPLLSQIEICLKTVMPAGDEVPFIILPGVSVAAALIVVIIHGLLGRFPFIIELTKKTGARWQWKLKAVHDLDLIRNNSRQKRFENKK